ncbi:DNA/RNA nuclease SfsA [uncultured Ruminococcus sp.]|jgi:sugar fermentation stimulation protein A|uniref:DNA/RNA nuclease SfsA n=1 Tax=uncultured Ruminococcus sp. TaxID=165186 RepID=UPI0026131A7A|nr:DNA/RNA nuclease SfsA [uncultured Ruminococcus sp.]
MQYQSVTAGTFLERPNRFIAMVDLDGRTERVHVKNTGRCRELLVPGYKVYLAHGTNPNRKTRYDLIAVEKERPGKTPLLINLDSQIPNDAAEEWLRKGTLFSENAIIEREVTYGNSRFDFRITDGEMQSFLEVKGVTLEQDGVVSFPDAPTQRGVKHLRELIACRKAGFGAYLLFVVQMRDVVQFRPHDATDPEFAQTLRLAAASGVKLLAMDCDVTSDSMTLRKPVPISL